MADYSRILGDEAGREFNDTLVSDRCVFEYISKIFLFAAQMITSLLYIFIIITELFHGFGRR